MNGTMNGKEIVMLADMVAREKNLSKEKVLNSLEEGIATAIRKQYPQGVNISVVIDPHQNTIEAWRVFELVQKVEDFETQITKEEAQKEMVELDSLDLEEKAFYQKIDFELTRQQFNITRQVALQKLRNEIKENVLEKQDFQEDKLLQGTVKQVKKDSYIVEHMGLEMVLPKNAVIGKERFKINDRIAFVIDSITRTALNTSVYITRKSVKYVTCLLSDQIRAISSGQVQVVKCSRIPGHSTKVVLMSNEKGVDAVRACIGPRGQFIKSVSSLMGTEGVDFISWSEDPAKFFISCMQPVQPVKISIDEDLAVVDVVVVDEDKEYVNKSAYQQHLSNLTGWQAQFFTQQQWDELERQNYSRISEQLIEALDIDEDIAQGLIEVGCTKVEDISYIPSNELEEIGIDEDTGAELKQRAADFITSLKEDEQKSNNYQLFVLGLDRIQRQALFDASVSTVSALSDLDTFELQEILPEIGENKAKEVIIKSRGL